MLTKIKLYGITLCVDFLAQKCYNIVKEILNLQRRESYERLYSELYKFN